MAFVMWAGLMMASLIGRLVSDLLPFEKSSSGPVSIANEAGNEFNEDYKELDLVA